MFDDAFVCVSVLLFDQLVRAWSAQVMRQGNCFERFAFFFFLWKFCGVVPQL